MTDYSQQNILAIDCAASDMKLGLQFGGDRIVKSNTEAKQSHSSLIIEKIQSLLESAGCKVNEVDAIVVCTGPGSFTGLRIGIACAKGMGVALNIPVVGVNLFEIAAYKLSDKNSNVKVIVPFKRDEVFTADVIGGKFEAKSIRGVLKKDLVKHISGMEVAGVGIDVLQLLNYDCSSQAADKDISGALELGQMGTSAAQSIAYDATELVYVGVEKLIDGDISELAVLEPLYVQKSQAEIRIERNQSK